MTATPTKTQCTGTAMPIGPSICHMSLRAWPATVTPCRPLRRVDTQVWLEDRFGREQCRCDRPELELILSPMGIAVEVGFGSADHRLCIPRLDRDYLDTCSTELRAEALALLELYPAFEQLILTSAVAREHILSLPAESLTRYSRSATPSTHIEYAKHVARTAIAREAAQQALLEMLGGEA